MSDYIPESPHTKRGVTYWPSFEAAADFVNQYHSCEPEIRIVRYELGWAIQRGNFGPYLCCDGSRGGRWV